MDHGLILQRFRNRVNLLVSHPPLPRGLDLILAVKGTRLYRYVESRNRNRLHDIYDELNTTPSAFLLLGSDLVEGHDAMGSRRDSGDLGWTPSPLSSSPSGSFPRDIRPIEGASIYRLSTCYRGNVSEGLHVRCFGGPMDNNMIMRWLWLLQGGPKDVHNDTHPHDVDDDRWRPDDPYTEFFGGGGGGGGDDERRRLDDHDKGRLHGRSRSNEGIAPLRADDGVIYSTEFRVEHCFMRQCTDKGCPRKHRGDKGFISPSRIM